VELPRDNEVELIRRAARGDVEAYEELNRSHVDRAIAEIPLALEANPNHHALGFLLAEAYRSEAELLERLEWWLRAPAEATS
jgi:hypothetical protein